jgi:glycolate oxidase iron-sulfur subunit
MDQTEGIEKPNEASYLNCIRCGLCLAVCQTGNTYKDSFWRWRARKSLEGELELSPNLAEQMYSCFACMACNELCPVGIHPADLALSMRQIQEQIRPAGWKQTLFGGLIANPGRMEAATLPLRMYQITGLRRLVYALRLNHLLPAQLRDLEAMLPHLPRHPLRPALPPVTHARGNARNRVGFFLGCAQSLLFNEESAATVRVLARNGCEVISPQDVQCCGMPARGYGRMDLVRSQAQHNIALFERLEVDVIVTDCATCGSTLKDYGSILKDSKEWAARAEAFSARAKDVSEYLMEIPLERPGKINARVTYRSYLRRASRYGSSPVPSSGSSTVWILSSSPRQIGAAAQPAVSSSPITRPRAG